MSMMAPRNKNVWDKSSDPPSRNRTWNKTNGRSRHDSSRSNSSQRTSSYSTPSDTMWDDSEEHFPALGMAPPPKVNVWEERKAKAMMIKEMEPRNMNDEEAMLQWALELSKQEAAYEEEKRKLDEENYKLQEEMLMLNPEFSEVTPDERTSEIKASQSNMHALDSWDYEDKTESNHHLPIGSNVRKNKIYSANRSPRKTEAKLEKIIDCFGGWGLGDNSSESNKVSHFVNKVIEDNSVPIEKQSYSRSYDNAEAMSTKINSRKSSTKIEKKNTKESSVLHFDKNEKIYDGKGTFTDFDTNEKDKSVSEDQPFDSPMSNVVNVRKENIEVESDNSSRVKESLLDQSSFEDTNNQTQSYSRLPKVPYDNSISAIATSDSQDNADAYLVDLNKEGSLPTVNSKDCSLSEHEILNLEKKDSNTCGQWYAEESEYSMNQAAKVNQDLDSKVEAPEIFKDDTFFDLDDVADPESAPILPPKPAPSSIDLDSNSQSHPESHSDQGSSFANFPSQPSQFPYNPNGFPFFPAQLPMPHLPLMNPFMTNPGFYPGMMNMNPMMGCAMDPLIARQMLMLSNPHIASQFFAMERHLLGMTPGVQCMQPQVPINLNPSIVTSPEGANVLANEFSLPQEQQLENEPLSGDTQMLSTVQSPPGLKSHQLKPPAVDANVSLDDDWLDGYLATDGSAVIPPPKPAPSSGNASAKSFDGALSQSTSIPQPANRNACHAGTYHPAPTLQASVAKTEVCGWSDLEDEATKAPKCSNGWGDDDYLPAKPLKSQGTAGDSRKPVCRQPMRQPHLSRYQKR